MAGKIVITITVEYPTLDASSLKDAIVMAVNEYITRRTPVEDYVAERYKHMGQEFINYKGPRVAAIVGDLYRADINGFTY